MRTAQTLIEIYRNNVGEKKKILKTAAANIENQKFDYRFIRGLALLLDRKGSFNSKAKIDPVNLRKKIFQTTEKLGTPTNTERRKKIIETVALETALTTEEIEDTFYADLDEELFLEKFDPPSEVDLLQHYNLSLTQTLLFDCTELRFKVSGNWQNLFYMIKKLGLIYEAYQDNGFWVKIDGPASFFKLTKKYGTSIAKLLPAITNNPEWSLDAKILWKYTNEVCTLTMDCQIHGELLPKPKAQSLIYDSETERNFAAKFNAARTGWALTREPEPLSAGTGVIIPDFSLERAGLKVYVEIVGFWTEEYLLRKAEKLKHVQERMLLLVDEALVCEKLVALENRPQLSFIYYKNKISLAPVLGYLRKVFEEIKVKETKFLEALSVKFTEPSVSFAEFAERVGISVETIRAVLAANPPQGYIVMPNSILSKNKLAMINRVLEERLKTSRKLMFNEATKIIEAEDVTDASCILSQLGYKVAWHGISSEDAQVYKGST
jgi:predicted nuclease of restriction endonuclease-like RecB superfamily